ncbi:hypothetical protein QYE76_056681 [Lolium multiflorum]|uniref:Reverse transcriptase domain-containing protein n=1 Tax=Lolium multiflorum TaxID=4521 RepID=A0AAD8T2K0_LOLMU|nr:hypothetical protein QYE76_056681 [Lolium multiflorum]
MTLRRNPRRVPQQTSPTPLAERVSELTTPSSEPQLSAKKSALRILNATFGCAADVKWSEKACTFDRSDHPAVIPKECYALVVSPRIDGYDFSKCLMDEGASLNIMYLETLEKMNLTKDQLKHSTTEFHGVVPGKKANSGQHQTSVAFGDNYREEMITFEVVPFKSSYHVIFGRPTYHKCHIPTDDAAVLKDQIGRNVHAYVDDIAVMTRKGSDLLSDLKETFDNLRRYKMMLNPLKCVFGVPAGKLLGFIEPEAWVMHFDGSKQHQGSGLELPQVTYRRRAAVRSQIHFEATNNMAEYEALLHGLRIAKEIGIKHIISAEIPTWWHNK